MPPKHVLPIHTNSITQPLHTVHTGHVSATFSVGIHCVRRADAALHRAVSTLSGMQSETRCLVLLVAPYIYKRWRTSFVQAKTVVEWARSFGGRLAERGSKSHTGQLTIDGLSLSHFADQAPNPTRHNLLTPPSPKKVVPTYGGGGGAEGSKSKNALGDHYLAK